MVLGTRTWARFSLYNREATRQVLGLPPGTKTSGVIAEAGDFSISLHCVMESVRGNLRFTTWNIHHPLASVLLIFRTHFFTRSLYLRPHSSWSYIWYLGNPTVVHDSTYHTVLCHWLSWKSYYSTNYSQTIILFCIYITFTVTVLRFILTAPPL